VDFSKEEVDRMKPLLEVKNLHFSYNNGHTILEDVSLKVEAGELLSIIGPNGAGKSTLLNCITGLLKPKAGEILIEGRNISKQSPKEIAKKIAYVPQLSVSTFDYNVRDYIAMGRAPYLELFNQPSNKDYELVDEAIELMGIEELACKPFSRISGGERQMVCVTRAIVQQSELILFDEPTSALDYGNQMKIMRIIQKLSKNGYSIIMTTHNPDHPILLGGKVAVVSSEGRFTIGNVKEIMNEEILSSIYKTPLTLTYVEKVGRIACIANKL
jgi:iron complex transport system ATP-binding protein